MVTSGNVYDARLLSQNLAAAAIECAGAITATQYILPHSIVDVPGETLRKHFTPNIGTSEEWVWITIATITVPSTYNTTIKSNCRVRAVLAAWNQYNNASVRMVADGVEIGKQTQEMSSIKTFQFNTTGGFVAGDVLEVQMQIAQTGTVMSIRADEVDIKSTRATDVPVLATFVESGSW